MSRAAVFMWLLACAGCGVLSPALRVDRPDMVLATPDGPAAMEDRKACAGVCVTSPSLRMTVLLRRLALTRGLRELVVEFVPLRSYYVTAWRKSVAFMWEVVVSPGGILRETRAELSVEFPVDALFVEIEDAMSLPRSSTLLLQVRTHEYRPDIFVRDLRSGGRVRRIRNCELIAVSPRGDTIVGRGIKDREEGSLRDAAIWVLRSGKRIDVPLPKGATRRLVQGAAYAPGGEEIAALVRYGSTRRMVIEIWSSAGEQLCAEEPPKPSVWSWPSLRLVRPVYFDGQRVAACAGPHSPGAVLDVHRSRSKTWLTRRTAGEPCEDVSLASGRALRTSNGVPIVSGLGSDAIVMARWQNGSEYLRGRFSPDGRMVAMAVLLQPRAARGVLLWRLADGQDPQLVDAPLSRRPEFSDDSRVLVGVAGGLSEAVVMDLAGGPSVRLGQMPLEGVAVARRIGW